MKATLVFFCSTKFYLFIVSGLRNIKWKSFFKHFCEAMGTLSAFATLIAFVGQWNTPSYTSGFSLLLIFGIVFIALVYTYFQMRSRRELTLEMRPQLKVHIREGNLLKEKGIIVIPVNNYFDTIVDDIIVSRKSVHGQFVNSYLKEHTKQELDDAILTELRRNHKRGKITNRKVGNKESWRLGAHADILWKDNIYVLFALTNFDDDNHAYVESWKIPKILKDLLGHLAQVATDKAVYMPLFGTGLSRLGKSHKRTLMFILDCIEYMSSDSVKLPAGLTIDLYSLKLSDINLDDISNAFKANIY